VGTLLSHVTRNGQSTLRGRSCDDNVEDRFDAGPRADAVSPTRKPDLLSRTAQLPRFALLWKTKWSTLVGLLGASLIAVAFGATGIGDEAYVSLQGDMPRYLMNGVYFHDLAIDRPFGSVSELVEYTQLYYARYPALSLGHHPPLLSVLEAPAFRMFGISITSARVVILICFVAAAAFLYLLVADICGPLAGVLAAAFFATSPSVVIAARSVLSEAPALALVIASAYCLHRFCATVRRGLLVSFVVLSTLSLYAKQVAILVFPAFVGIALMSLGVKRLIKRDILLAFLAIVVLTLPLVAMTYALSQTNVMWVVRSAGNAARQPNRILSLAAEGQFVRPVLLLSLAGAGMALWRIDKQLLPFLIWVASVLLGLLMFGAVDPPRYSVYWVPALCALAAAVTTGWRNRLVSATVLIGALLALSDQALAGMRQDVARAEGYEAAAEFVLQSNPGPTVLFSGDVDSGFFAFFIRKHDSARRLIVLRSDKILTTSFLGQASVEDRIKRPDEIYAMLQTFGVKLIVIEDRPSESKVLEWLREELRSSRFSERKRIPFETSDRRLRGTSLVIYEYMNASRPSEDAVLSMNLPLVGRSVTVRLSDLVDRKYLR
jgi:dolichyl-phosphate-mannose-protein mannosyltransferase